MSSYKDQYIGRLRALGVAEETIDRCFSDAPSAGAQPDDQSDAFPYSLRTLRYPTADPVGEKRRLSALNVAMNAYQLDKFGGRNAMSHEDIVKLAREIDFYVRGGWEDH